jgi:hypothetical protein
VWWYQSPGANIPVCVLVAPSGRLSRSDHTDNPINLVCSADKIHGAGWILRASDFMLVLDLLIFRQPGTAIDACAAAIFTLLKYLLLPSLFPLKNE